MSSMLILEAAGRSCVMGSIIWLALRVLRVRQIRALRLAWLLALGGALLMPVFAGLQIGLQVLPAAAVATTDLGTTPSGAMQARAIQENAASQFGIGAAGIGAVRLGLVAIYFATSGLLLLRLVRGVGAARRIRRRATPIDSGMSCLDVRVSGLVTAPVTIGTSIILPEGYTGWTQDRLKVVLGHESAHVRQRDFQVQLLAGLHCALFWFSPFSWWLRRQLADLGEALSDHAGVQNAASRARYAEILLSFARGAEPTESEPTAAVAMARSSNLSARIERLLGEGFHQCFANRPRAVLAAALVAAMALGAATSVSQVQAATHGFVNSDEMYAGDEAPPAAEVSSVEPSAPDAYAAPELPPPPAASSVPPEPPVATVPTVPLAPAVPPTPPVPSVPPPLTAAARAHAMSAHARALAEHERAMAEHERESAEHEREAAEREREAAERESTRAQRELTRAQLRMEAAQKQIAAAMQSPEFRSLKEQQGRLERQMRELAAQEMKLIDQAMREWKSVSDR